MSQMDELRALFHTPRWDSFVLGNPHVSVPATSHRASPISTIGTVPRSSFDGADPEWRCEHVPTIERSWDNFGKIVLRLSFDGADPEWRREHVPMTERSWNNFGKRHMRSKRGGKHQARGKRGGRRGRHHNKKPDIYVKF